MEIKIENAKAALKTADESVKKVLLALLPELNDEEAQKAANRPVTERIKTFEDACRELGSDHPMVLAYQNTNLRDPEVEQENSDIIAYLKLRIVCAALNEGWEPRFTEDEERWYPWFALWTDDELSEKSDEWKEAHALISTKPYIGEWAGFAFAYSNYAPSDTNTYFGSRLCLKSEALATYCGKQFISLWADFNLNKEMNF